jgi:hypothetical protein
VVGVERVPAPEAANPNRSGAQNADVLLSQLNDSPTWYSALPPYAPAEVVPTNETAAASTAARSKILFIPSPPPVKVACPDAP